MRPTISEQLAGSAELLRRQVMPHVGEAFAASQLTTIADALERLAGEWGGVVAGLVTAIVAGRACCSELARLLAGEPDPSLRSLAERLETVGGAGAPSDLHADGLLAELDEVRGLVAESVVALAQAGAGPTSRSSAHEVLRAYLRGAVAAHLDETPIS